MCEQSWSAVCFLTGWLGRGLSIAARGTTTVGNQRGVSQEEGARKTQNLGWDWRVLERGFTLAWVLSGSRGNSDCVS